MRAVLDVLEPGGEVDRSSDGLAALADRARAAGIANSLSVTGTPPPSHTPVSLAVNRIVRECLTNAGRHAPGEAVSLDVEWRTGEVVVHAMNRTDSPGGLAPGRGLTGIRHRAELFGGTFTATDSGGVFDVRVHIPAVTGDLA
jgi:signal transduction histidine kinase